MTNIYSVFSSSPTAQLHLKFPFAHSLCLFHAVGFQGRSEQPALLPSAAQTPEGTGKGVIKSKWRGTSYSPMQRVCHQLFFFFLKKGSPIINCFSRHTWKQFVQQKRGIHRLHEGLDLSLFYYFSSWLSQVKLICGGGLKERRVSAPFAHLQTLASS